MKRDAALMRGDGPTVFAAVKHGEGMADICANILSAQKDAAAVPFDGAHDHSHGAHGHSHGAHGHRH